MIKNIYLAGRLDTGEGKIGEFADELENRDHRVMEKWWEEGRLPKPYLDHPETSSPAARAMIEAAFKSDVFLLFPEDTILGAVVEFGAALGGKIENRKKEIIVVGAHEVRQSVFYAHPDVLAVKSLDYVRNLDWFK